MDLQKRIKAIQTTLQNKVGERNKLQKSLREDMEALKAAERLKRQYEQALAIVQEVGLKTQVQLQFHIADLVTMAFDACQIDYEFQVEFVERRNKTECDLLFRRGENTQDPQDASGGGAIDVASFALRIASWTMKQPRSRNVIILDEPMRFLSTDLQPFASQLLKELSEKLNLQFIIVTHEEVFTAAADKVFQVKMKRKKSYVTEL